MQGNPNTFRLSLLIAFSFIIMLSGCGKSELNKDKKDIIAYVNKEPIYEYDVKREIAMRVRHDPNFKYTPESQNEQLDILINKKLVIQEAMEKGLARSERFIDTIKAFWEQTLIRDFLDLKKIEFKDKISATTDEINKYYDNLSNKVTFKILKSASKAYIDEAYNELIRNKNTTSIPFETLGPVGYDEIASNVLFNAFEQPIGEVRQYSEGPYYYLIVTDKKDKREIEPLENLKLEIEKRIIAKKEARLLEEWLSQKRKQSKVKIIKK